MNNEAPLDGNAASRAAWEANAAFWDERMGDGNDFVEKLCWPAIERLLALRPGERILDAACGNGLTSRRLATAGAQVVAFDFSAPLLEHARARSAAHAIDYRLLDATDERALLALGEARFDGAISNMALMDIAEIAPLFNALARVLRPGGRFVFSVMHPAFNGNHASLLAERIEADGASTLEYSVRVRRYLTPTVDRGIAIHGQPEAQPYFGRPLQELLRPAFEAGLVVDGLEERAFDRGDRDDRRGPTWDNVPEIPPVLVVRVRRPMG
jgi:SAM-dependent methyltransferase